MQNLEIGKKYAKFENGSRVSFEFEEGIGEFAGLTAANFLHFILAGGKQVYINGGEYERLCDCGNLIDSSYSEQNRTGLCHFCLDASQ